MSLLEVEDLRVEFETLRGKVAPIDGISFRVEEGETVGIVGESGCGKSMTSLAIMGLLPANGRVSASRLQFGSQSLYRASERQMRSLRGKEISMIFQDPMTSLNPSFTVGFQIMEMLKVHQRAESHQLKHLAMELLEKVGIPAPEHRFNSYPHELSGGMCQRIMIAMAISCRPRMLIADEPTTALDVTIQAQILALLDDLKKINKMSLILITHDLSVVARMADRIIVMYAGHILETGSTADVIRNPKHPYTVGLLKSLPSMQRDQDHRSRLLSIPGLVPDLVKRPQGCQFHPRCSHVQDRCRTQTPDTEKVRDRTLKCFFPVNSGGS